ncbi:hypothetical protein F4678DRAFT_438117 [Xylaria arbuscula]|nr:hypothetical protein F4678DRAFT_438117 [Xylaria arbuscula]
MIMRTCLAAYSYLWMHVLNVTSLDGDEGLLAHVPCLRGARLPYYEGPHPWIFKRSCVHHHHRRLPWANASRRNRPRPSRCGLARRNQITRGLNLNDIQ